MRNILCITVSQIKENGTLEFNKKLGHSNTFHLYEAMSEIVIHSARRFIKSDFDVHIIRSEVNSYQEIFHTNFQKVYDLWRDDGPNNILYLDGDTLVTGEVNIFDNLKDFQMFNYTASRKLKSKENKYNLMFEHYFNAGIRYYPATMNSHVWDTGWEYAKDWDYDFWGTEQAIFNKMMYSQNPDHTYWLKPDMGFQVIGIPFNQLFNDNVIERMNKWNNANFRDAKIMHLHGTRDAVNTLVSQWVLWRNITGEEFKFSKIKIDTDSYGNPVNLSVK